MIRNKIGLFLLVIVGFSIFWGCDKETETIIKTVTVRDTIVLTKIDTVTITEFILDSTTTFILSRHAETTGIGTDPSLSAAGQERATELARVLKNTQIHAVYSTNYNRTKETSAKISTNNNVSIQIYDPSQLDNLVTNILEQYKNKVVYIAGHSNTTNALLNVLVGSNVYGNIPDSEYDNLYIVSATLKGNAHVIHLKYGK
jgi:broad specificity phosphatase PhoE